MFRGSMWRGFAPIVALCGTTGVHAADRAPVRVVRYAPAPAWVIAAPKGIPAEAQKTLGATLKKVYDSKEYKDFMASRGFGVVWADAEGTAKFMAKSDADMGATLKAVGLAK